MIIFLQRSHLWLVTILLISIMGQVDGYGADTAPTPSSTPKRSDAVEPGNSSSIDSAKEHRFYGERKYRIEANAIYGQMSVNGNSLKGFGIGGSFLMAVSNPIGLGASLEQVFSTSGGAFYSQMSLEARYALTGSLILRQETHLIGGHVVYEGQDQNTGGLRLHLFLHDYFISGLGFYGLGAGVSYEFSSSSASASASASHISSTLSSLSLSDLNYRLGLRIDYATGNSYTFYPIQLYFGVSLPL